MVDVKKIKFGLFFWPITPAMQLLKEFRPALFFLGKFLAVYVVGNVLYGLWIEFRKPEPDLATRLVSVQSAGLLKFAGYDVDYADVDGAPKVAIIKAGTEILHVFEGCNGLNVMIVFVAFLFAFGGNLKKLFFFLPAGLFVIHIFNLLRLCLLFHLAIESPSRFYYYHKYFFTAILYFVVFALWAVWVIRFHERPRDTEATA